MCKTMSMSAILILMVCMVELWSNIIKADQEIKEYCLMETFQPVCQDDEIVVMEHAMYGRMNHGKCLKSDEQLGCSVDVLELADKMCSGHQSCSIFIPNPEIASKLDCLDALSVIAYFEASFYCQKVIPRAEKCRAPEKIKVTKQKQHIFSKTSEKSSCGIDGSPWILDAEPGQHISLNIMDFSWVNNSEIQNNCPINYGFILDMANDDVISICGGTVRKRLLHLSSSHSLQIVLETNAVQRNNFILSFSAHGCPEYTPPLHSWIQKENDSLVIGCAVSDNTWKLTCVDNRWLGIVGNCTPPTEPPNIVPMTSKPVVKAEKSLVQVPTVSNNHVIMFTLACLTLLACCVIIILGIYCTKRYDVKIKKYTTSSYNTTSSFQNERLNLNRVSLSYKPIGKEQFPLNTMNPPAYTLPTQKEQQRPEVPPRNVSCNANQLSGNVLNETQVYENVTDDTESVQYYVLENPAETGCNV